MIIRAGILTVLVASSLSAAVASAPPAAALTVPVVAGNGNHDCAAMPTNRLFCWGDGRSGQLGNGKEASSHVPVGVKGIPAVFAVDGGAQDSCAIDNSGQVWCWGANNHGQLGDGTTTPSSVPVKVQGNFVAVEIAVGTAGFACALTPLGRIWCWGAGDRGQLGIGGLTDHHAPVELKAFDARVEHIDAGGSFACAVVAGGRLVCWGANGHGQIGDGTTTDRPAPFQVSGLTSGVTEVSTGTQHACAILDGGALICWGANDRGQLGIGSTVEQHTPQPVAPSGAVQHVSAGEFHTCALVAAADGSTIVQCWGWGLHGTLGDGVVANHIKTSPSTVFGLVGVPAGAPGGPVSIAAGAQHTCVVLSSGEVECWGYAFDGQLGDGTLMDHAIPVLVIGLTAGPQAVALGAGVGCALTQQLSVMCWGTNGGGSIGNGTTVSSTIPEDTALKGKFAQLSTGSFFACALPVSGTSLDCWGEGFAGQLGDGSLQDEHLPVPVSNFPPSSSKVVATYPGAFTSCAMTTANGTWCWGANGNGELGDASRQTRTEPERIKAYGAGIVRIEGSLNSCAVRTDGSALCTGENRDGELGTGSAGPVQLVPVAPKLPAGRVIDISTGLANSCAVMSSGAAYCWGRNDAGEVGDGSFKERDSPVPVSGLSSGVVQIAAGAYHTCALMTTGGVKCWGLNDHGQLGDGTNDPSTVPVDVVGLSHGVVAITGGAEESATCALVVAPKQQVECWGSNRHLALGDGNNADSNVPVVVQGL